MQCFMKMMEDKDVSHWPFAYDGLPSPCLADTQMSSGRHGSLLIVRVRNAACCKLGFWTTASTRLSLGMSALRHSHKPKHPSWSSPRVAGNRTAQTGPSGCVQGKGCAAKRQQSET